MIRRTLQSKLLSLSRKFPVVAVTGPRQSGKTTLAKACFPKFDYVSLEDPNERDFATSDPKGFLGRFRKGAILDEVQRGPGLFSVIQGLVDANDSPGRFILTGSQQYHLMEKVTQTLAGRVALLNLFPFTTEELFRQPASDPWHADQAGTATRHPDATLAGILFSGLYPRIHDKGLPPHEWLSSYYQTYVERDVREVANFGNLDAFQRFVRLCAGRSGQLLNLSSLAADAGISHTTAGHWISVLQAGFIIHLLSPHHQNFNKRLIKSPKLYFFDTGLMCFLLRIRGPEELAIHSMRGQIFETFVVSEYYKAFAHRGEMSPLYFWRDRTGHEVDLLIDAGTRLVPVEIKSGETVDRSMFDGLRYFMSFGAPAGERGIMVHGGDAFQERDGFLVRPWFRCV